MLKNLKPTKPREVADFEKMFHEKRELCNEQRRQIMKLEEENAKLRKRLKDDSETLQGR